MGSWDWEDEEHAGPRNVGGRPASTKTNRQVALRCDRCAITLYTTRAMARKGIPVCACGFTFEPRGLADRWAIDPDGVEDEFWQLGRVPFNDLMRELGKRDRVISPDAPRSSVGGMTRCKGPGNCTRITNGGPFCDEHKSTGANYAR